MPWAARDPITMHSRAAAEFPLGAPLDRFEGRHVDLVAGISSVIHGVSSLYAELKRIEPDRHAWWRTGGWARRCGG